MDYHFNNLVIEYNRSGLSIDILVNKDKIESVATDVEKILTNVYDKSVEKDTIIYNFISGKKINIISNVYQKNTQNLFIDLYETKEEKTFKTEIELFEYLKDIDDSDFNYIYDSNSNPKADYRLRKIKVCQNENYEK